MAKQAERAPSQKTGAPSWMARYDVIGRRTNVIDWMRMACASRSPNQ